MNRGAYEQLIAKQHAREEIERQNNLSDNYKMNMIKKNQNVQYVKE